MPGGNSLSMGDAQGPLVVAVIRVGTHRSSKHRLPSLCSRPLFPKVAKYFHAIFWVIVYTSPLAFVLLVLQCTMWLLVSGPNTVHKFCCRYMILEINLSLSICIFVCLFSLMKFQQQLFWATAQIFELFVFANTSNKIYGNILNTWICVQQVNSLQYRYVLDILQLSL